MKKTSKVMLGIAIALIVIGGTMLAVGSVFHGWGEAQSLVENVSISKYDIEVLDKNWKWKDNAEVVTGDVEEEFDLADFDNLDIKIGGAKITIMDTDDSSAKIIVNGMKETQCLVENRTLSVTSKNKASIDGEVILYLPSDKEYKNVKIDAGASEITGINFVCDTIEIDLGAGDAQVESLIVKQTADLEVGAGNMEISYGEINDVVAEIGMGNLDFDGTINGNMKLECGMGAATLNLDGSSEDHNYVCTAGLGSITIDGDEYAGTGTKISRTGKDVHSEFEIECGMGGIEINFAE